MPSYPEKMCADSEIFQDKSLQTSQQFQALQQGVPGEEKWEASTSEVDGAVGGACVVAVCCGKERPCSPATEKG